LIGVTNNAWDLESFIIQEFLQIQYIQVPYLKEEQKQEPEIQNYHCIKDGVIVTNHRSFADFFIDPYIFQCPGVARILAVVSVLLSGITGIICNRMICINRNHSREEIYFQLRKKKLFYFYPEGTRCKHLTLPTEYKDISLKPGLLKSVYEDKDKPNNCIQVVISKNNEEIVNEKKLKIEFGKNIIYCIGKSIYVKEYETFDDFFNAIKKEWKYLWDKVYGFDEAKWIKENDEKYDGLYDE
jgi:1-acyl-sn-glycerol-3-phosphate acyltransferase